jgi:hypothetical protein
MRWLNQVATYGANRREKRARLGALQALGPLDEGSQTRTSYAVDCVSLRPQRLCKGVVGRLAFLKSLLSAQSGRLFSVQRRSQQQDSPSGDNASDDIYHWSLPAPFPQRARRSRSPRSMGNIPQISQADSGQRRLFDCSFVPTPGPSLAHADRTTRSRLARRTFGRASPSP